MPEKVRCITDVYILLHLKKAKVDYAKMMAKVTGLPLSKIKDSIDWLIKAGLIERDEGSAIKKSKAKFKKAYEVHKHHTYYKLSREGELLVRKMDYRWFEKFLKEQIKKDVFRELEELYKKNSLNKFSNELTSIGFITKNGRKTKFFEAFAYVSGFFENKKN